MLLVSFYTHKKQQGFLFSVGIEKDKSHEIVSWNLSYNNLSYYIRYSKFYKILSNVSCGMI